MIYLVSSHISRNYSQTVREPADLEALKGSLLVRIWPCYNYTERPALLSLYCRLSRLVDSIPVNVTSLYNFLT